jgi:Sulfotransferase domain
MTSRVAGPIARGRWTAQRFGLSPAKSRYRVANPGAPKVLCVSIPKSGTHLLERALCLHPKLYRKVLPTISDETIGKYGELEGLVDRLRSGQVIVSHLRYDARYPRVLQRRMVRGLFLIRDPHDVVVSQVHYVTKTPNHRHHDVFLSRPDLRDRLALAIAGDPLRGVASIRERLDAYAGWLDSDCLVVRFEDLVGPEGGGSANDQVRTMRSIFDHLWLHADWELIESVCRNVFSAASPTFRSGAIGQWRNSFDPELEALLGDVAGDALARYGYEVPGAS